MRKWIGVTALLVTLAGCSAPGDHTGSGENTPAATPQQSPAITQPPQLVSPEPTLRPSSTDAGAEQTLEVLDIRKLGENFGFADAEGQQILITGQEADREKQLALLDLAIGNNGQVLKVKYTRWQPGNEGSTGREMSHNFSNLPGYLFTVEEGSAAPDVTYYLTQAAYFNLKSLLTVKPANIDPAHPPVVEEDVRKAIIKAKKREIKQIGKLADLSPGRELYVAQFVRQNKDMLFSIVLKEEDALTFMDYPAVSEEDDYSVWRVDDGGEATADMFTVLFAAETADGVLIGLNGWGAEGVNTFFLNQNGAVFKELDIQYGRYTSPL